MNPQAFYQTKIAQEQHELKTILVKINRLSWLRLVVVLSAVPLVYLCFTWHLVADCTMIMITLLVFITLVLKQQTSTLRKDKLILSLRLWQNEIDNIKNYSNIYYDGHEFVDSQHPYTFDLDIFGRNSIFNFLSRARTYHGIHNLANGLKRSPSLPVLKDIHVMVKELVAKPDWRHEFALRLWPLKDDHHQAHYRKVLALAEKPVTLGRTWDWLLDYSRWAILLVVALAVLTTAYPGLYRLLVAVLILHAYLNLYLAKIISEYHQRLTNFNQELMAYAGALELADQEVWTSESLKSLVGKLINHDGQSAVYQIHSLAEIGRNLDMRLNMLGGFIFNVLALWDFRQLRSLKRWQQQTDQLLPTYFTVLGELEVISSLATLHFNQPQWVLPELVDEYFTLEFTHCAHPLIPASERVGNDYRLAGAAKVDIITGSNMSGKSTFLRTLGVNFVLAHLGAPICASAGHLSPAHLYTSMRIADDVTEHISTFKAELNRLRLILEALDRGEEVFVLLDEMLRGTNSQDKYQGSRAMIKTLLNRGAIGLVATHDLQLAALEDDYPQYIRNYYFDITVKGKVYRFDYTLKPGRCQTFNATLLLRELGLEV